MWRGVAWRGVHFVNERSPTLRSALSSAISHILQFTFYAPTAASAPPLPLPCQSLRAFIDPPPPLRSFRFMFLLPFCFSLRYPLASILRCPLWYTFQEN